MPDDDANTNETDTPLQLLALRQAQKQAAMDDPEAALVTLSPWADFMRGQGAAAIQQLRILCLQRTEQPSQVEDVLAAFQAIHPHYPMRHLVEGAAAWANKDWWTSVLAYLEVLMQNTQLTGALGRINKAVQKLGPDARPPDPAIEERLRRVIQQWSHKQPLDAEALLLLCTLIRWLPLDPAWSDARRTALDRVQKILTPSV
ncbi:MAG: hypothetical protein ACODUE_08465 [Synechococcus sp.]